VGVDAARYFFLIRKLSAHFDFDISLAQKKSDENPVFYVQYAHARTCNLLRHAASSGIALDAIAGADCTLLSEPETMTLIKEIAQFPDILLQAAAAYEPNRLTTYCESLAAAFHAFYQKHRIVTEDRALTLARLYLTTATRNTIRLALDLLGVSAPENM
jgi:arginyl-tRNA synthetase